MLQDISPKLLNMVACIVIVHSTWVASRNRRRSPGITRFFGLCTLTASCLLIGTAIGNTTLAHYLELLCFGYAALMAWAYGTNTDSDPGAVTRQLSPQGESNHPCRPPDELSTFGSEPLLNNPDAFSTDLVNNPIYSELVCNIYHRDKSESSFYD